MQSGDSIDDFFGDQTASGESAAASRPPDQSQPHPSFDEQGDPVEPDDPGDSLATVPPDHRFIDNPLTARGTPRKIAPRCSPTELNERVEWCRGLIRLNFSAGDIKRLCAKKWNLKRKTIADYISYARQRNRSILDATEDQMLADSLAFWSKKQQHCEATIQRERELQARAVGTLQATEREIDQIEGERTAENPQTERLEILEMRKKTAVAIIDHARRAVFSAEQGSRDSQDRIDRLKGNFAPLKLARVTKDGADVDTPANPEPATLEDCDREIEELAKRLQQRAAQASAN